MECQPDTRVDHFHVKKHVELSSLVGIQNVCILKILGTVPVEMI